MRRPGHREGELIDRVGVLWGGSQESEIGLLEKRREQKALAGIWRNRSGHWKGNEADASNWRRCCSRTPRGWGKWKGHKRNSGMNYSAWKRSNIASRRDSETRRAVEPARDRRGQEAEETAQLQEDLSQGGEELEALEARRQELAADIAEAQHERQELAQVVEDLQEKVTAHQVALGTLWNGRSRAGSTRSASRICAEAERRLCHLREEGEDCRQQLERAVQEEREIREHLDRSCQSLAEQNLVSRFRKSAGTSLPSVSRSSSRGAGSSSRATRKSSRSCSACTTRSPSSR